MPAGRPPFFNKPEELEEKIQAYFEYIKGETLDGKMAGPIVLRPPEPQTITGLALFLGFESRQSFYDYEKNDEYSYIIKRARLQIEVGYEVRLHGTNPTGAIFALKNMGWTDKQEIDQKTEHSGSIAITWQDPELPDPEDKGSS